MRKARSSILRLFVATILSGVSNRCAKLTLPFDSPDSYRLIGRMVSQLNRPVPEWCMSFSSAGTADPVNTNCPTSCLWSTSNLMVSHSLGASCHSSISLGVSPSSRTEGSISAICRFVSSEAGLSIYKMLFACCSAVVVFPHHLGPSISIAPLLASFFASIWSAILCLYSIFMLYAWFPSAKIQILF